MVKKQVASGVSIAIRQTMFALKNSTPLMNENNQDKLTIKIANTLEERESAFRLAYQMYLEKGFLTPNTNEWLVNSYDADEETVILIVLDSEKKIVGTLSLVFGLSSKLPVEKIYKQEIKALNNKGD